MSERKSFLLRLEPALYAALARWAADDLRSLNAQIEYLLRQAARDAGRFSDTAGASGRPVNPADQSAAAPATPAARGDRRRCSIR